MKTLSRYSPFALVLSVAILFAARASCGEASYSDASLSGVYAYLSSGDSLYTMPEDVVSIPVYLGAIGLFYFDGKGRLHGNTKVSATRKGVSPSRKAGANYSSQVLCLAKMSGTYTVDPDGQGKMTIDFTPETEGSSCGATKGMFNFVIVSPGRALFVSAGQTMSDPSKGEFNSYVVQGEMVKRATR